MIRTVAIEIGFFLTPFALYAAFLYATSKGFLHPDSWSVWKLGALTATAIALMVVGLVFFVERSGSSPGTVFIPAHLENGKLVPGAEKAP